MKNIFKRYIANIQHWRVKQEGDSCCGKVLYVLYVSKESLSGFL